MRIMNESPDVSSILVHGGMNIVIVAGIIVL